MRTTPSSVAVAALAAAFAAPIAAHESWLHAEPAVAQPGVAVAVGLTSGMAFPKLDHAVARDRLDSAQLHGQGQPPTAVEPDRGRATLRLAVECAAQGLAMVSVSLQPRTLTLEDAQVPGYLDEIGAPAKLRARWDAQRGRSPWTETYTKSARLVLAVGDVVDVVDWPAATSIGVELVPVTQWAAVRAGEPLTMRLTVDGAPVAGQAIVLRGPAAQRPVIVATDAQGLARFTPTTHGPTLLHATLLEPAEGGRWSSRFVTFAFQLRDAR
jgi:hypothetical protein